MEMVMDCKNLRKALAAIEAAEARGFNHCLAVFDLASAGRSLDKCKLEYSDLYVKAHPTDPSLNWGRFQGTERRCRFENGQLVSDHVTT